MIQLKSERQLGYMQEAGRIVAKVLEAIGDMLTPGVTTAELNALAEKVIRGDGGVPLFLGYRGFPAASCISINEEVVHGIPGQRRINEGDLVSVDVGVRKKGWCGDAAKTFAVGDVSQQDRRLMDVAAEALSDSIDKVRPGRALAEVCGTIQSVAEKNGFSVVKQYTGHGIGRDMHEEPQIPNFVDTAMLAAGVKLEVGMVLAIEPMLNAGASEVETLKDGWTVVTSDRRPSAHFEHTVAVTKDGPRVLTHL